MPSTSRIDIRLTQEEKEQLKSHAEKLNLDISGYIKLIISLDASTGIIQGLKQANKILQDYGA